MTLLRWKDEYSVGIETVEIRGSAVQSATGSRARASAPLVLMNRAAI